MTDGSRNRGKTICVILSEPPTVNIFDAGHVARRVPLYNRNGICPKHSMKMTRFNKNKLLKTFKEIKNIGRIRSKYNVIIY